MQEKKKWWKKRWDEVNMGKNPKRGCATLKGGRQLHPLCEGGVVGKIGLREAAGKTRKVRRGQECATQARSGKKREARGEGPTN